MEHVKTKTSRNWLATLFATIVLFVVCGFALPAGAHASTDSLDETSGIDLLQQEQEMFGGSDSVLGDSLEQAVLQDSEVLPGDDGALQESALNSSNAGNDSADKIAVSEPNEAQDQVEQRRLMGYALISGNTKIGCTLVAGAEGAPCDAVLQYQWYRDGEPIAAAASNVYTTVDVDANHEITCRITASGYKGVLVSGAIKPAPLVPTVLIQYWSTTDDSPHNDVVVHTETAKLTDLFNYKYDPNKDDDPTNDYTGYALTGWFDEFFIELYECSTPEAEFTTTIEHIADLVEWDGVSPINVYAYMNLRYIEVTYFGNGYELANGFDPIQTVSWWNTPYHGGVFWHGYKLVSQTDALGNVLTSDMSCGYVLTELLGTPWADTLEVYLNWEKIEQAADLAFTVDNFPLHGQNSFTSGQNNSLDQAVSLPSLVISGNPKVGNILVAEVEGPQEDTVISFQWYRDDSPIEGATLSSYRLVQADGKHKISCRAHAQDLQDELISNSMGPVVHIVTVEYWSNTDTSPSEYVIVHTETAELTDIFNHKYDQNKDDDPTNDRVGWNNRGWWDSWQFEYYDSSIPASEFLFSLGEIAELTDWDGVGPIVMYSNLEPRIIEITYHNEKYAQDHAFESVRFIPWDCTPYYFGLIWGAHRLVNQTDDQGHVIDGSMTCEYILTELLGTPWANKLNIHINWEELDFKVHFIYPNDVVDTVHVSFEEPIDLPNVGAYPGREFKGWFTEENGAGRQLENGVAYHQLVAYDTVVDVNIYAYFVSLPLTGSVVASGDPSVGSKLIASVNGVPADVQLKCQWYRGEEPIPGATTSTYAVTYQDIGCTILCKVIDSNYAGTLVSNAIGPIDQVVDVLYWSYTDESPDEYVVIHTEQAKLSDIFNYKYDQNNDFDPTTNCTGYTHYAWMDEWGLEYYLLSTPEDEFVTTIADIARNVEWDGVSPINVYSYLDMRYIEVRYNTNGYSDYFNFDEIQTIAWFDSPYVEINWWGHKLIDLRDDLGNSISQDMNCGYILTKLLYRPELDSLNIHLIWEEYEYRVSFVFPDGSVSTAPWEWDDAITFPEIDVSSDQEFFGWFTEPNGAGKQVTAEMTYGQVAYNDHVEEILLYAFVKGPDGQAFAVFSADDMSFTFFKRPSIPNEGDVFEGKTVTKIYSDFEDDIYEGENVDWLGIARQVKSVLVADQGIRPLSTARWFGFFNQCTSFDIALLDTSRVTTMESMFNNCESVVELDLTNFNTSQVTSMNHMFHRCTSLTSLDLSSFDTSQVVNTQHMFYGCSSLETIDLSTFEILQCENSSNMFAQCTNLTTIFVSTDAELNFAPGSLMFSGCMNLVGGRGTTYGSAQSSVSFARIDGVSGKAGFFTPKITVSYCDPVAGAGSVPVLYTYGMQAEQGAFDGFLGWSLEPNATEPVYAPGDKIFYNPTDPHDIVLYPVMASA